MPAPLLTYSKWQHFWPATSPKINHMLHCTDAFVCAAPTSRRTAIVKNPQAVAAYAFFGVMPKPAK